MKNEISIITKARREIRKNYRENIKVGMSRLNAAVVAGFPTSIINNPKHKLLSSLVSASGVAVRADFITLFERKRMTDLAKVEHCLEGMQAMKTISVETDQTNERGRNEWTKIEVPDWIARHKYFETMLKLCKQLEKENVLKLPISGEEFIETLRKARTRASEEMKARFGQKHVDTVEAYVDLGGKDFPLNRIPQEAHEPASGT